MATTKVGLAEAAGQGGRAGGAEFAGKGGGVVVDDILAAEGADDGDIGALGKAA